MLRKNLSAGSILLSAVLLIGLGVLLIIFNSVAIDWLYLLIGIFLISFALLELITLVLKKTNYKNKRLNGSKIGIIMALGVLILIFPNLFIALFPISFALYSLINCVVRVISYVQLTRSKTPRRGFLLLGAIVSFVFFVILLFNPFYYIDMLTIIVGIYLITYGVLNLGDFLTEVRPDFFEKHLFHRIRIPLPAFIATFIPHNVVTFINDSISNGKKETLNLDVKKTDAEPDLEIFVYVGEKGVGTFGHIDFCFEGCIYSYGAYDEKTSICFGGIGEGCYYKTKQRDAYLNFCLEQDEKTIFGFGIALTDEQKKLIKKEIAKIEQDIYVWNPQYLQDIEDGMLKEEEYEDFASKLAMYTGAKFYKFKRSSFKYYFVMHTNCVKLPERILMKSGAKVLAYTGIVSPGTFYDYLDYEFVKANSNIISRTVYHKDKIEKQTNIKD